MNPRATTPITHIIHLIGCDDYTRIPFLCNAAEIPTLICLAREINNAAYGCKPTMEIYQAEASEDDDWNAIEDHAGRRWTEGKQIG
mgnify:FL=1